MDENFALMHDNTSPHAVWCMMDYLKEAGISTLNWSTKPTEHMCDILTRRTQTRAFTTAAELWQELQEEWKEILQEDMWAFIRSNQEESQN
ncbi:hypothetical protein ANN_10989 [Periplaneta americana]|uniref:Tc1-like transposase DDE domain-containing protein n=1 Tax=Periplaneta americana TaxID=6978 RepID=A0ABQ8T517_PERAM|nr:hypothetical protein ANN_10989 [Periplaneta americana]